MAQSSLTTPTFPSLNHRVSQHGSVSADTFLDKLAQLRKGKVNELSFSKLEKRARAKALTLPIVKELSKLKTSPLRVAYERSLSCCSTIEVKGGVATSRYCNGRWCMVCNRIRTGKLINAYEPILSRFKEPVFLTLTAPSVSAENLSNEVSRFLNNIRRTHDVLRKKGVKVYGVRKLEITWNKDTKLYHPHFHFIIDGWDTASMVLDEWMKRNPKANRGGQDLRKASDDSVSELFKYFTKIVTKGEVYPIKVLDTIFKSMKGRRVFQSSNLKLDVSEDIDELQSDEVLNVSDGYYLWHDECTDWINFGSGEVLSGYKLQPHIKKLISTIKRE